MIRFKKETYSNGSGYSLRCEVNDECESIHIFIPAHTKRNINLAKAVLLERAKLEHGWKVEDTEVYCPKHRNRPRQSMLDNQ